MSQHLISQQRRLAPGALRVAALAAAAAMAVAMAGCSEPPTAQAPSQAKATPVGVVQVQARTVELDPVYAARTQAAEDVEVRARVQGTLLKRHYTEGSLVKAGALLFEIDPAPFEARVQQADADLNRAQAQFRQAEREWTRTVALFSDNAVSARDRDAALSTLELAQAEVATARAQLRDARIQLGYTRVTSPIAGHAGMRALSEGNLVAANALLTTVHKLDPIQVVFAMPEADALALRQRAQPGHAGGTGGNDDEAGPQALSASLQLADGTRYAQPGVIDFTATTLDPQTGTLQARASFANPGGQLLPGQFVRLELGGLAVPDTIVVPQQAVGQGAQGPTVFVVDDNNRAELRTVKLRQSLERGHIVTEGIEPGDRVIVYGVAKVRAGQPVAPTDAVAQIAAGAAQ